MTTSHAVKLFLTAKSAGNRSKHTLKWYRIILGQYAKMFPELPRNPESIEAFIASCVAGDERKHGYYRALRAFYHWLKKRHLCKNPLESGIDIPKVKHKQLPYLHPQELNQLIVYPHSPDVKAALLFMTDTGARLSEVNSLQPEKLIDLGDTWEAKIDGKTGERTVPISYETYHAMMIALPYKYNSDWLGRRISQAFKDAGIKGTAHVLRHTFGTLWEGDESVLQSIMGHSTIKTTMIYRHPRQDFIHRQHALYSPLRYVLKNTTTMI